MSGYMGSDMIPEIGWYSFRIDHGNQFRLFWQKGDLSFPSELGDQLLIFEGLCRDDQIPDSAILQLGKGVRGKEAGFPI